MQFHVIGVHIDDGTRESLLAPVCKLHPARELSYCPPAFAYLKGDFVVHTAGLRGVVRVWALAWLDGESKFTD